MPSKRCQSVLLHHCAHQFTNLYWKWHFRFSIWDLDQNLVGNWNLVKVRLNHPMHTVGSFRCTCKLAGFIWNGTRITGTICVDRTARQKRELTMYVYIHLPNFFFKITLAKVKERKKKKKKGGRNEDKTK